MRRQTNNNEVCIDGFKNEDKKNFEAVLLDLTRKGTSRDFLKNKNISF